VTQFIAATLPSHIEFWKSLTSDSYVLNIVYGYEIQFTKGILPNKSAGKHLVAADKNMLITKEIDSLLQMGVIETCQPSDDEYISPVFMVQKSDGSFRKILNLKKLNEFVEYEHFKMENLQMACALITPGCYMTSVDLMKAYYSVAIRKSSRKYLRFKWNDQTYQYRALPNGLSSAPRVFTRLMRVLFSQLRENGAECIFYLDDSFFVAPTVDKCANDTRSAVELLSLAGFSINHVKSVLRPTHRLKFLGFEIDSLAMKIFLPENKQSNIKTLANELLNAEYVSIERLAQVIGTIVAYLPAFPFGKLHYRGLEKDKIQGLENGSYKSKIKLSNYARDDLNWWLANANKSGFPIQRATYSVELFTDASQRGYGAALGEKIIGSRWTPSELDNFGSNINCLELLAVFYALKSFCCDLSGKCVCVRVDNTTAVTYINMMGGTHSSECNRISKQIWHFAIEHNISLEATHIAGKQNCKADYASRHFNDDIEISLNSATFQKICDEFDITPEIDLFASRHNNKVAKYSSWMPDPCCSFVDSLSLDWSQFKSIYVFPPFSLWGQILDKLRQYKGSALVVYPAWKGQYWFPALTKMLSHIQTLTKRDVQPPQISTCLHNTVFLIGKISSNRN